MDDGSSDDADTADEGVTVLEHHQALADAGTLDPLFLVRLTRPDKHVTPEEWAVLRFLRATETGAGCSRRQVEALLDYTTPVPWGAMVSYCPKDARSFGTVSKRHTAV
jgi:hypothetical protein